jgi:GT2 family glycosyltransferase
VIDDASNDDSKEVIKTFSNLIVPISLQKNVGLSAASNLGIKTAKARYMVRVDADDYVHASFLSILLTGFELLGRECEAIAVDYQKVTPEGEIISYGNSLQEPIACGVAFKMDAIEQLGFYDESLRLNEEVDLRNRFISAGFRTKYIPLPLYRYVQHGNSMTNKVLI